MKVDVLGKVKPLITEYGCEIPDVVINRSEPIELKKGIKIKLEMFPVMFPVRVFDIFAQSIVLSEKKPN